MLCAFEPLLNNYKLELKWFYIDNQTDKKSQQQTFSTSVMK